MISSTKSTYNKAINADHKKRLFALLFVSGYGWRYDQQGVVLCKKC